MKKQQIKKIDCSKHIKSKCKTSAEILYKHVRCGLVHNYFQSEGYILINRPNKKQSHIIVDQSKKFDEKFNKLLESYGFDTYLAREKALDVLKKVITDYESM